MGKNIFVFKFLPMEGVEVTGINFEPTIVLGYCWSMDLLKFCKLFLTTDGLLI